MCARPVVGSYVEYVTPHSIGETGIPFNPGLAIPAWDALCAYSNGPDGAFTVTRLPRFLQ